MVRLGVGSVVQVGGTLHSEAHRLNSTYSHSRILEGQVSDGEVHSKVSAKFLVILFDTRIGKSRSVTSRKPPIPRRC